MGMIGNFLLLSDERLSELLADPEQVHDACDDGYDAGGDVFVDVDKAWQCIHYLLTGSAEEGDPPLNFILCGGREVGDEDVGYGPARAFSSDDVAVLAKALEPIDRDKLMSRFHPAEMDRHDIYPDAGRWSEMDPSDPELSGYYSGAFEAVKALVQKGAAAGSGMLVWLC